MSVNQDTIGLIKQRLEILWQLVESLETGGGGSPSDAYTKAQTDALLNGKVDKVAGSSLMTTAQANKLAGIQSGAEVNVQADWDQTDTTADDFIKNKPVIPDTSDFYTKSEIDSELSGKVDKQTGYSLISNANITKLNGIAAGAEVNVQANWNETNVNADSYIRNKPTIPDLTNYYTKTQTDAEIQGAITDLDVSSTATTGHYIKSIAQEDGLIVPVAELADTVPTIGSKKLITSGAVYTGLSGKATPADITSAINALDAASVGGTGKYISAISETNGVISATESQIDSVPTENSTNPITSGVVYDDRTALAELINSGAKNLLKISGTSQTISGVTFTVNSDGSISASGTATSDAVFNLTANLNLQSGSYVFSPGFPNGSSGSTFFCDIFNSNYSNRSVAYQERSIPDTTKIIRFIVAKGYTANNITLFPMVCTAANRKISAAFVPYRPSYQELCDRIDALEEANANA